MVKALSLIAAAVGTLVACGTQSALSDTELASRAWPDSAPPVRCHAESGTTMGKAYNRICTWAGTGGRDSELGPYPVGYLRVDGRDYCIAFAAHAARGRRC